MAVCGHDGDGDDDGDGEGDGGGLAKQSYMQRALPLAMECQRRGGIL